MRCFLRSISFFTPQPPHNKQRQREDSLQKHLTDASTNANTNLAKKLAASSTQLTLLYIRKKTQDHLQFWSQKARQYNKSATPSFHFILKCNSAPLIFSLFLELYIHPKHSSFLLLPPNEFNMK